MDYRCPTSVFSTYIVQRPEYSAGNAIQHGKRHLMAVNKFVSPFQNLVRDSILSVVSPNNSCVCNISSLV